MKPEPLHDFLSKKPLFYDKIDLSRMPRAYEKIENDLRLGRVVHLVGTNGKGSTGRMLAQMLRRNGRVGHYTSPHILCFNERIWIDGSDVADDVLETAHQWLYPKLGQAIAEELSYFEYTTLLALAAFEGCDFVVLEAGLGGEYDATAVVDTELTVVTPVGVDHTQFLGETVAEIAATKMRAVRRALLLAPRQDPAVVRMAHEIAKAQQVPLYETLDVIDDALRKRIEHETKSAAWPDFLIQNAMTAAAAYRLLIHETPPLDRLFPLSLPGRFQRLSDRVVVDVGHNEEAARAAFAAMRGEKWVLVYNALADKPIEKVLEILAPALKRVEIVSIEDERAASRTRIVEAAGRVGLSVVPFEGLEAEESYFVFGSFRTVEAFLKRTELGA